MKTPAMTEKVWQAQVCHLAHTCHWSWYHTHDSRRSQPGFPDLVLVRERIIYVELKTQVGRLSPEQVRWKLLLEVAGGEWYLWRPSDLEEVAKILGNRAQVPG